jgi:alpha-ribazole phosphatase
MHLTLIRHIKTVAPQGMCYGQADIELPPDYEKAHQQIASMINVDGFDAIYSSPLKRCALLAKHIAGKNNVNYDNRLMELNFGDWEQLYWSDIEKTKEAKAFFDNYYNTPPPNGESLYQMKKRVAGFYLDIKHTHNNNKVLIIAHAGTIRMFNSIINNIDTDKIFDFEVEYGQIIKYLTC